MSRPVGRPPKYKSVEEIEQKIEAYFKSCEGEPLKDRDGTVLTDKYGAPIIVGKTADRNGLGACAGLCQSSGIAELSRPKAI